MSGIGIITKLMLSGLVLFLTTCLFGVSTMKNEKLQVVLKTFAVALIVGELFLFLILIWTI